MLALLHFASWLGDTARGLAGNIWKHRRSAQQFTRKLLALVLVEVVVVSNAMSLAAGPGASVSRAFGATNAESLAFLLEPKTDSLRAKTGSPFTDPEMISSPALTGITSDLSKVGAVPRSLMFQSTPPGISGLQPNSGAPGDTITITGLHFGTSQGSGGVTFNGAAATIVSWSDTSIQAKVPTGGTRGNVVVTSASNGASGGAPFAVINPTGVSIDQIASGGLPFSTNAGNELLLAFVAAAPGLVGSNGTVSSVSGGNLTWTLVKRTNGQTGTAEIWRAFASSPLNGITVTANLPESDVSITVISFMGVDTSGTNGSGAIGATGTKSAATGGPTVPLTTTRNNSLVFAVGEDYKTPTARTASTNQTIVTQQVNTCTANFPFTCPTTGDTLWVQQLNTAVAQSATAVNVTDTAPTGDPYNYSAVEILPASSPSTAPIIKSLSAISGAPGTSITITGANFGATTGSVSFNGTAATPTSWSSTSVVVPVPSGATTGNATLTAGSQTSNGLRFIVANPAGLAVDRIGIGGVTQGSIDGATLTTSSGNEVLLALVGTAPNGSSNSGTTIISPPQGGGLTWVQVESTHTQGGTAEIWRAFSPYILNNVSITYNPVSGSDVLVTVVALLGADTTGTNGSGAIGATATANGSSGAPSANLTTTRANSFVFGAGDDSGAGVARTVGTNQTKLAEAFVNNCSGSLCTPGSYSLWTQQVTNAIASPGTSVTLNDTAPTNDPYNLSIVEIIPPAGATPTITSLAPTTGPVGTSVTITGTNFGTSQGTSTVTFAGVTATPTSWSNTSIVVPVPQGVPVGPAAVVVTVTGAGPSNSATFTVVAPLAITASATPAANAAGWNHTNVTISYTCTGGVTPVQCPSSQTVTTEGAGQSFTATATDANNNHATVTTPLSIDKTAPSLAVTSPANNSTVITSTLVVSGTVSDALSGVAGVSCNGTAGTVQGGNFNCSVALVSGPNTISVSAADVAGNTATQSVTVTVGPSITDFTPKTGPVGTAVSILGNNLIVPPNASTVTFTGSSGPVTAHINFSSNTQIAVVVPTGAITGPITVTNSAGSAATASPFTVGPRQDFQVTVSPGTGTVPQGSVTSFAVALTSQQTSFTQLATLSVSGAPAGVSAVFSPPQITAGATSSLLVDLGAANLATGSYSFLVHAAATIDGAQQDRTASVVLNVTAAGPTTLAGQVVSTSNQPIVGATVSLDGQSVLTDGAGRFLLSGIQSGTNRSLSIDGHSASSPNATFPLIFEPVNVLAGRANVVSTPFHLPPIDTSQEVTINPNADTVAGNASVTGLQMTIPQGAHLRMLDGTLVTRTSITPLAPDRTPAPLPSDVGTNIVYTSQPGGAITDIPIPVVYPNLAGLNPGTEVELYAFDHAHVNWFVYGKGMVSADGRTIAPEINPATGKPYGLPDFSWHFPNTGPNGNPSDPHGCPKSVGPHPVDYSTGMKIEKVPQVAWGGARGGITFGLVYTTDKAQNCDTCPYGRGWTNSWDIRMSGTFSPGGAGRVIFPDQVTGRLFSSSGTDASGTPRFTTTATVSQLGASVGGGVIFRGSPTNQYRDPDGTTLYFNSSGRLIAKVDANGNTTTLDYSNGNLTKITDPVGRSLTFTYDGSNRVSSMTDPLNRTWRYTYEGTPGVAGVPGLTTITDPAGNVTRFTYVTGGRIAQVTDARGNAAKLITYDANGRVASQTFADGGTETYTYQLSGTIVTSTTVKSPTGATETRRFNASGYVISITDASGQIATIQRDLNTNVVTSVVGSCGCNATQRTVSLAGDVTSSANATGGVWNRNYDPNFHVVTTVTDPLNNPTVYTYDQKGNLQTKKDALQQITTYGYDGFGELTSTQTPAGGTTTINYDPQGNISSTVDAAGKITNFEYDALGHIKAVVDPLQRRSTMDYDEIYRLVSVTDPALNTTHYEYDANSNRTAIVNPFGKRWVYGYDARNRLVSRTDPLGHQTSYTYDADDRLLTSRTPLGRITSYAYTPRGQIASKTAPNGETTKFEYDSTGNITKVIDARGHTISNAYDASNRLTSRTDPLGRVSTITYDAAGNVTSRSDRFGRQTTYTYDVLNRPIQVHYPDATVNVLYDPDGRITEQDDSTGGSIHWAYDDRGRLSSETTPGGIVDYAYNDAGQPISMGVRGRVPTQYGYDGSGRLSSITFGTKNFSFQYDQAGRRTVVTRPNGITSSYTYDDANHLVHISHSNAGGVALEDLAYTLDNDGRLISAQSAVNHLALPAAATAGTFDANNRPSQFNTNLFSFDDLGELLSSNAGQSSTTYQWDGRGRLSSVHLPNGSTVQYSYDAMSRLASRSVNGAATNYLYTGNQVLLRTDNLGNQTDFINGAGSTERLLQTGSAGDVYFLQDRLASVISLADSSGAVVEQESYEPFGNTLGSGATEYGYIGQRLDPDTHLMMLNARFYDPVQQRFITEDPIGTAGGINVFAYSANDPVNAADPSGLYWCGYDALSCAANIAAGAGDKLSFGFTNWVRDKMGTNDVIDKCGLGYEVGGYVGDTVNYSILALSLVGPLAEAGAFAAEGVETAEALETESGLANDLEQLAKDCAECFPAGTPVQTKRGLVPIEKIEVGDEALSRNQQTGKLEYKKVVTLVKPHQDGVIEILVSGEIKPLRPTGTHPFFVKRGGDTDGSWLPASAIRAGDHLLNKENVWVAVMRVSSKATVETVYNFEVEDNHNFYVGSSGLLVHNSACDIAREAAQGFKYGECVDCANAVEQALVDAGESGTRISINTGDGFIASDFTPGENIATNGIHEGVETGGQVFDNITPNGVPLADWLNSLHSAAGPIINFIKFRPF
jgi:RHS repeat-associated protein